jgi:saccharopine dehydrogenase (NAD+, L-lysine-forming)
MDIFLKQRIPFRIPPRILVSGYGTVAKSCISVLDKFGLSYTVKRSTDIITPDEILSYDIYIHAIRLMPERESRPFLEETDLERIGRRLTLISDLSCDLDHPRNPLPIYHKYGTKERPIQQLREGAFLSSDGPFTFSPPLHLLSVPYLPSFDPIHSSIEFSSEFVWYLSDMMWMKYHPTKNHMTRVMMRSLQAFEQAKHGINSMN